MDEFIAQEEVKKSTFKVFAKVLHCYGLGLNTSHSSYEGAINTFFDHMEALENGWVVPDPTAVHIDFTDYVRHLIERLLSPEQVNAVDAYEAISMKAYHAHVNEFEPRMHRERRKKKIDYPVFWQWETLVLKIVFDVHPSQLGREAVYKPWNVKVSIW